MSFLQATFMGLIISNCHRAISINVIPFSFHTSIQTQQISKKSKPLNTLISVAFEIPQIPRGATIVENATGGFEFQSRSRARAHVRTLQYMTAVFDGRKLISPSWEAVLKQSSSSSSMPWTLGLHGGHRLRFEFIDKSHMYLLVFRPTDRKLVR